MKSLFNRLAGVAIVAALLYSCASIGRPEGGAIDETPPRFVGSTPLPGALNNSRKKITIEFDEFIKLDKPGEKIVISPPQVQQPEIKSNRKENCDYFEGYSQAEYYLLDRLFGCRSGQ